MATFPYMRLFTEAHTAQHTCPLSISYQIYNLLLYLDDVNAQFINLCYYYFFRVCLPAANIIFSVSISIVYVGSIGNMSEKNLIKYACV